MLSLPVGICRGQMCKYMGTTTMETVIDPIRNLLLQALVEEPRSEWGQYGQFYAVLVLVWLLAWLVLLSFPQSISCLFMSNFKSNVHPTRFCVSEENSPQIPSLSLSNDLWAILM
jgi:hypothetical protein